MPGCRCKSPPGGGIECNENQMAVCRVLNGQCQSQCIDVPRAILQQIRSSGFNHAIVIKWLASALGVETRKGFATSPTLKVLSDGTGYFYRANFKDMIRFSLPKAAANEKLGAD